MKLYIFGEESGNPQEWEGLSQRGQERAIVLAESPEDAKKILDELGLYVSGEPVEVSMVSSAVLLYEEWEYPDD